MYSYLPKNETLIFGEKCLYNPWNLIPDLNLLHQLRQALAKHVIFPITPKNLLTIQSSNLVLDLRNSTLAPYQSDIINHTPGALTFASNMSSVQDLQPIRHYSHNSLSSSPVQWSPTLAPEYKPRPIQWSPTPALEHGSSPIQWAPTPASEHKSSPVQWSSTPASEHRSSSVQWSSTPAPEHRPSHLRSSPIFISTLALY